MIRIAFCDDELSQLDELSVLLGQYRERNNKEIGHRCFHSPYDLLAEIERGDRFDIVFLDILMPGETGIDVAAEIRNFDSNVKIIFLTSSDEYAVQSYTVGAFYYQMKPVISESFFRLMDSVLSACEKEQSDSIILRCKSGITRIDLGSLEYCEVIHRTLYIHLSNGKILECTGSLDDLSRLVEPYGRFLRVHRSYLVNLDHIRNLSYRTITMSCLTEIPIPRGKFHNIKDIYLEHAFLQNKVIL